MRSDIVLRIAICDDHLPITTEIESMLRQIAQHDCIKMDIDIYFDGKPLYRNIKNGNNYDLIYMDIEMDDVDGIQAAHLIRAQKSPTLFIYISSYDTYFKQLFEVEPFRFISKPIDFALFYKYFKAAYKKINSNLQFFTFGFHQKYTNVPFSEIIYLESFGRDIIIHTPSTEYRFIEKLDTVENYINLHNQNFLRIHQSYLINPYHIHSITSSKVELSNNYCLRIGPKFQEKVRSQYIDIIGEL